MPSVAATSSGSGDTPCKWTRSQPASTETIASEPSCFFCGHLAGNDGLHEASTFQNDHNVRASAAVVEDTELLARHSMGDMVALEAKYHTKRLLALYNRARRVETDGQQGTDSERVISGIAFGELVMYIEETRLE